MNNQETLEDLLFVGTHGHAMAIHKASGQTVWSTSLPRTGYSVVSIVIEDGLALCASGGRVFALDPLDGDIKWTNDLPGKCSGLVYLTTALSSGSTGMTTLAAQAAAAAAAAAT